MIGVDLVIFAARLIQFAAAATLFGGPAFLLYAMAPSVADGSRDLGWGRRLIGRGGGLLVLGALASLLGQTASMAGDPAMAFDVETLTAVLTSTSFGYAIGARLALAVLVVGLALALPAGQALWSAAVGVGALILASFAWTGHGATEDGVLGLIHAAADAVHLVAAGVWLGALVVLSRLLWVARGAAAKPPALTTLHRALENFSGIGSLVVAILLATGLVNSWFLVGPAHLGGLVTTPYGRLLLAKIGLFGLMLALAGANRFRLNPALGQALRDQTDFPTAIAHLRRSVLLETTLGLGILVLVSLLGMYAPVAALS